MKLKGLYLGYHKERQLNCLNVKLDEIGKELIIANCMSSKA